MTITLATLPQATAQEVIDQVYLHLLTQNEASRDKNGTCSYRSPNGLKCAAGCLIADDEYETWMDTPDGAGEGTSWESISIKTSASEHKFLIQALQYIHDDGSSYPDHPERWKEAITSLAKDQVLEDPVQKYPEPKMWTGVLR